MWMWNRLMQKVSQMHNGVRSAKMGFHVTMLMLFWSGVPLILPSAYSQPKEPVPVGPVVPPPPASIGIDGECRAALEKLCQGIEPGCLQAFRGLSTRFQEPINCFISGSRSERDGHHKFRRQSPPSYWLE